MLSPQVVPIPHTAASPYAPVPLTPAEAHAARRCQPVVLPCPSVARVTEWGHASLDGEALL